MNTSLQNKRLSVPCSFECFCTYIHLILHHTACILRSNLWSVVVVVVVIVVHACVFVCVFIPVILGTDQSSLYPPLQWSQARLSFCWHEYKWVNQPGSAILFCCCSASFKPHPPFAVLTSFFSRDGFSRPSRGPFPSSLTLLVSNSVYSSTDEVIAFLCAYSFRKT